ncbi:LOW QUALITY PROTEIN: calcium homeostasis modulator protein 6-like [Amazona ochrocephala]
MDTLRRVLDFCIRHQTILGYSIVSLLTAAIEFIFTAVVFKCPCNSGNVLYGSVFLIVPVFIVFYMVNLRMWRLLTGMRTQEKSCSCRPWGTCAGCFCMLLQVIARAVGVPFTWLAVALLRASFYECMASGSSLIKNLMCKDKGAECQEMLVKIPCDEKLSEKISSEFLSLQAQSQVKPCLSALHLMGFIPGISVYGVHSRPLSHCIIIKGSIVQIKMFHFTSPIEEFICSLTSKERLKPKETPLMSYIEHHHKYLTLKEEKEALATPDTVWRDCKDPG